MRPPLLLQRTSSGATRRATWVPQAARLPAAARGRPYARGDFSEPCPADMEESFVESSSAGRAAARGKVKSTLVVWW
jgi:hypothetical protein